MVRARGAGEAGTGPRREGRREIWARQIARRRAQRLKGDIAYRGRVTVAEAGRAGELSGEVTIRSSWAPVAERVSVQATDHWDDRVAVERLEKAGANGLKIVGDLTIHGVTKPVTLTTKINKIGENPMMKKASAGFDATTTIKRSEFGVDKYVPNVSDEIPVRITFDSHAAQ